MFKRGLSNVLATVLLVLIVLVGVVLMWFYIRSSLQSSEDETEFLFDCFGLQLIAQKCVYSDAQTTPYETEVIILRTDGKPGEIKGARLVFYDSTNNFVFDNFTTLEPLENTIITTNLNFIPINVIPAPIIANNQVCSTNLLTAGCKVAECGNGEKEPGEYCDDGNTEGFDSCPADCGAPECADGYDNDGDGSTDYPSDEECFSESDDETPAQFSVQIAQPFAGESAAQFPADLSLEFAVVDSTDNPQEIDSCAYYWRNLDSEESSNGNITISGCNGFTSGNSLNPIIFQGIAQDLPSIGDYEIYVYVFDISGDVAYASEQFYLEQTEIKLLSPTLGQFFITNPVNVLLNITFVPLANSCFYSVDGGLRTVFAPCQQGLINYNFVLAGNQAYHTLEVFASDQNGESSAQVIFIADNCPGNIVNAASGVPRDGVVTLSDQSYILGFLPSTIYDNSACFDSMSGCADLTADGRVNIFDLQPVLTNFGTDFQLQGIDCNAGFI